VVKEAFGRGYGKVVEDACGACVDVGIEGRADFGRRESTRLNERKLGEVDCGLRTGEGNVAGDGVCRAARCAPVAFVLRRGGERTDDSKKEVQECSGDHGLRMTFRERREQTC